MNLLPFLLIFISNSNIFCKKINSNEKITNSTNNLHIEDIKFIIVCIFNKNLSFFLSVLNKLLYIQNFLRNYGYDLINDEIGNDIKNFNFSDIKSFNENKGIKEAIRLLLFFLNFII